MFRRIRRHAILNHRTTAPGPLPLTQLHWLQMSDGERERRTNTLLGSHPWTLAGSDTYTKSATKHLQAHVLIQYLHMFQTET